jgi:hypothetical protein
VYTAASPFSSQWTRALALLLLAALGLQAAPVQPLVQHLRHGATHQHCSHPEGVCPMNPDGPCTCDHDAPPSTDGPVFEGCSSPHSSAIQLTTRLMLVFDHRLSLPAPRSQVIALVPRRPVLTSQRVGDDVFHPPRTQADERPVATQQASISA